MLKLEIPNESHQTMWEEMIEKWGKYEEIPTSPSLLFKGNNFKEFLEYVQNTSKGEYNGKAQSTLYFGVIDTKIVGAIDIRHTILHPYLRDFGGHIGYGICPDERGKGYATEILRLGLMEAKKLGIEKVLISCHPDNPASEKVILKNGGIYEETVQSDDGGVYMRHWIQL